MRYAAGCLCSALLASLFTSWMLQPPANRVNAQESGPVLPGTPTGPSQSKPPSLPPRQSLGRDPAIEDAIPSPPRAVPNAAPPGSVGSFGSNSGLPSLRPIPDPISEEPSSDVPQETETTRGKNDAPAEIAKPALTAEDLSPGESIAVSVYERCNRGVVNITSKGLPGERFFFMEVPADGSGSGSIIDREGHILTNYHVVEKAQQVEVALFDGSTFDAKYVGADPVNDLAVIKIDAPADKLFPIEVGDSSRLKVGMNVFAIGNPFGLERTMTSGIVSSLNRSLQIRGNRSIKAIIQTDAAVNPGNSGGPLLDTRGQLIGVNTAIATANAGQSAGVALAIPATLVNRVVPQLLKHGRVIRPEIGIQQVLETERGLRIAMLTPGGPAERAGLRGPQVSQLRRGPLYWTKEDRTAADLIVAVDGEDVETADDFLGLVERKKPGDTVVVKVLRGNQTVEVPVVLSGPMIDQPAATAQPPL
jgi:S1-C subfamily serine protease